MKYKISEFAKTFGVSAESIRYYEKIGLIKSYRNKENNYRYYDNWDLFDLANYLIYKDLNFSLEECIKTLNSDSADFLCDTLEIKTKELKKKIKQEELLLDWMSWRQQDIRNGSLNLNRIIFQDFPKMCLTETFTTEGDLFEENFLPHLKYSAYETFFLPVLKTTLTNIHNGCITIERGKFVFEKYGNFLDEKMPKISEIIPKQTYITYTTAVENLNDLASIVKPLLDEIEERNYKVKDEIYGEFVIRLTVEEKHLRYIRFMVPLK